MLTYSQGRADTLDTPTKKQRNSECFLCNFYVVRTNNYIDNNDNDDHDNASNDDNNSNNDKRYLTPSPKEPATKKRRIIPLYILSIC